MTDFAIIISATLYITVTATFFFLVKEELLKMGLKKSLIAFSEIIFWPLTGIFVLLSVLYIYYRPAFFFMLGSIVFGLSFLLGYVIY